MIVADLLANWAIYGLLVAFIAGVARFNVRFRAGLDAMFDVTTATKRSIVVGILGGFATLGILAALGLPVVRADVLLGDGADLLSGLSAVALLVGALSLGLPLFAGVRGKQRLLAAARERPGRGLPRSGPVVLEGPARAHDETLFDPLTGAEVLLYDARPAALSEELSDDVVAGIDLVDGRPFVVDAEEGEVVVDPADAAVAIDPGSSTAQRVEPGDSVTVLGSVDRSGTDRPRVTPHDGRCYVTGVGTEALDASLDRQWRHTLLIVLVLSLVAVVVDVAVWL